jgi:hypothetical protein
MGLTISEYHSMTPYQFSLAAEGYMNRYWKQWEHTRHISYVVAQSNSSKTLPPPSKWMPLPTDNDYKPISRKEKKAKWQHALKSLKEKKAKGIW